MQLSQQWMFKSFRLDPGNACLWRGARRISLTPKAFQVLQCLVTHTGQLVTKDALLGTIWHETLVGDAVLKVCIREIRQALGDAAKKPRFIATVHRLGYRFIPRVTPVDPLLTLQGSGGPSWSGAAMNSDCLKTPAYSPVRLVGREAALTRLHGCFEQICQSKRQLIFVTGEAGIGKTAVVEAFSAQVAMDPSVWISRGECVEHYGVSEAYLPVFEALGRLCRAPGGHRLLALLRQQAPNWLLRMPWLLSEKDRDTLQHELLGSTHERMLLELAEVIEVLTAETPLVLVFEDLHWSDYATLDLISYLARRGEPARLLLIGTYRPVEVIVDNHPLKAVKQVLQTHGQCTELPLELLSAREVATYLERCFRGGPLPAELVRWIYHRTDGNPLFLVTMMEFLITQRILGLRNGRWTLRAQIDAIEVGIPESLIQLVECQLDQLKYDEQCVLETASVTGEEFSAAVVAAGLDQELIQIEEQCDALALRRCFIQSTGIVEWPDGTVAARYRFLHWIHLQVLYRRIGMAKRIRLQQRIDAYIERMMFQRC